MAMTWKPRHLLAAWGTYWIALTGVKLGPAIAAMWRVTRPGQHGSVSLSYGDSQVSLTVANAAATVYQGATPLFPLALWIGVPPLLLWLGWLALRSRTTDAALGAPSAHPELEGAGAHLSGVAHLHPEAVRAGRGELVEERDAPVGRVHRHPRA